MMSARRRALYEEIERLPENQVGEIVDGELFVSPRPASPHALAASMIAADLIGSFHGPPGGAGAHGGDDAARAEPFEAAAIEMRRWWID